jgi:iron complex outermembrane receptor protein
MLDYRGFVMLLAMTMMLPVSAWSQEEEKVHRLETLTVTAQKTGENIQEVPLSVTAFSDVELEERRIHDLFDVVDYVPNLFIRKNSTENLLVIRGISSFAGSLFSNAGFYLDGVNYPINQMQHLDLLDIERIEVLKGPQGTLYGRNSQSGVINIITKQPTEEYSGTAFIDVGAWDADDTRLIFEQGFAANLPLAEDTFRLRVSAQMEDSGGWMRNVEQDENALEADRLSGRLTALWTPIDNLDISFIVEGRKKDDGLGVYRYIDGDFTTDRNELAWDGDNKNEVNANTQVAKIEYSGNLFDITSVTTRHDYEQDFVNDLELTPINFGPGFENSFAEYDVDIISEEIRLSSKESEGRTFDWLAGVFGYVEDIDTIFIGFDGQQDTEQDNWGAAAFGQATWNITQALHLTVGGRVDHVQSDGEKELDRTAVGGEVSTLEGEIDDTVFLPSANIAYDINDNILTYAKVSRGYLAGGFDYSTAITEEQFQFDPEFSWNYEVGVKSQLLDKRLLANVAAFYINTKDKQVAQIEPVLGNPEARNIINAADASAFGVELELEVLPVQGLILGASVGYLDSTFGDFEVNDFNFDDKETPGSPKWTYAFSGTYRWDNGFFVGTTVTGVSSYFSDTQNEFEVDGRTLVNPRVGYEGERFDVVLWSENIFDEDYDESEFPFLGTLVQQGEPRSFGLRTTFYF